MSNEEINFVKRRVTFISVKSAAQKNPLITARLNGDQNVIEYKALAKRAGLTRRYEVKVGVLGTHSPIGQAVQAIGSTVIPGNLSPIRSPIRSGLWGAVTPGKPSLSGAGGANRAYRCPEGYQYGGRFTDSRLSTCGAKLFDIPSAIGLAIGALRRLARGARAIEGASTPITGEAPPDSIVQSRRPQIPRVGNPNPAARAAAAKNLVSEIGRVDSPITRMVRKDGFVLEPVVPAQVLRAIPDNRDMEGADYIMSVQELGQLGGQELGLLSNTGVTKLTYVLPGGSTLSLEKKRQLTVGERRKLGRTVNAAAKIDISKDPAARLREVVVQTGDGIGYQENFVNIKNPNEIVAKPGGKSMPKWADEIFGKGRKAKPVANADRQTDSSGAAGKDITSLAAAIEHIVSGRPLSDIDPSILQQALSKANVFKRQKLDSRREIAETPGGNKFTVYTPSGKYEHLGQKFASDMQQHLGLESPDVFFVGTGDKRKYMVEDPAGLVRGFQVDRKKQFSDYKPEDVAKLLVSDWLTDQRERDPGSIVPISNGGETKPIVTNNFTSGLSDLDEISIVERQKMTLQQFMSTPDNDRYAAYFQKLQQQQRFAFRREIDALLLRARQFNFTQFKNRLYSDGRLTDAEKAHLNIVGRILELRIQKYADSRDTLMEILGATK